MRPVSLDRVLRGLLAGQLVQHGHRRRRHLHRLQGVDLLGLLDVGQRRQLLNGLGVADALAAQLMSSANRSPPMTRGSASEPAAPASPAGLACLLAEMPAGHGASLGRRAGPR